MKKSAIYLAAVWALISLGSAGQALAAPPVREATHLWMLKVSRFACASSPALAPDGTIYQATFDGTLLAISPQGAIGWTFATDAGTEIKSSPTVADDGTIYFGSRDRRFYAVTPQGKLKWAFATGGWVDSSPAIAADGTVYFGGWDKNFYALNPAGTQQWIFPVGAMVVSSPAIALDGTIYFGALDKNLYALHPDGKLKWSFATGGEITSSPAIGANGTIYINSTDGYLYAVKSDGTERWRFHTGSYTESSPILDEHENVVIAGVPNDHDLGEYVVNQAGEGRTFTGLSCPEDTSALAVTGEIYCSRPWRNLQAFHTNGDVLWLANTASNLSGSPVAGADGTVYVLSGQFLFAIRPADGPLPLAKSTWPMFRANPRHTGRVDHRN